MRRAASQIKLKKRILYTILLVVIFRALALVPVFDVDKEKLHAILAQNPLLGSIDLFAGGGVLNGFSIVATGIFPFIIATLLVNAMAWFVPSLNRMKEANEKRLALVIRITSVLIAFLMAWAIARTLSREVGLFPGNIEWFSASSFWSSFKVVGLLTLGSIISTFVSDLITKKGIYKGEGVLLLVGSMVVLGQKVTSWLQSWALPDEDIINLALIFASGLTVIALSYFLSTTTRKIPIENPRTIGRMNRSSVQSHVAFRYNAGGTVPITAAVGLLILIHVTQEFFTFTVVDKEFTPNLLSSNWLAVGTGWYWLSLGILAAAFTYVCNFSILHGVQDGKRQLSVAESMRRRGEFIVGLRPGAETEQYLIKRVFRISWVGALAVVMIASGLPFVIFVITGQDMTLTYVSLYLVVGHWVQMSRSFSAHKSLESYDGIFAKSRRR